MTHVQGEGVVQGEGDVWRMYKVKVTFGTHASTTALTLTLPCRIQGRSRYQLPDRQTALCLQTPPDPRWCWTSPPPVAKASLVSVSMTMVLYCVSPVCLRHKDLIGEMYRLLKLKGGVVSE